MPKKPCECTLKPGFKPPKWKLGSFVQRYSFKFRTLGTQSSAIQMREYLPYRCPYKGLNGTVVNWKFLTLIGKFLEITLTVLLSGSTKFK